MEICAINDEELQLPTAFIENVRLSNAKYLPVDESIDFDYCTIDGTAANLCSNL